MKNEKLRGNLISLNLLEVAKLFFLFLEMSLKLNGEKKKEKKETEWCILEFQNQDSRRLHIADENNHNKQCSISLNLF